MTKPDADSTAGALVDDAGTAGSKLAGLPARPNEPPIPTKTKNQNIRVSPAVLDAARKDGEELLRNLRTSLGGLTQAEAEERARTTGPNEIAQERKQGWPVRVLKIIRNPLVILLSTLSAVSFLTGDARAGSVMAIMVALSVGLRFWQEARADAAAEKLKAMIHVTATVVRDSVARVTRSRIICEGPPHPELLLQVRIQGKRVVVLEKHVSILFRHTRGAPDSTMRSLVTNFSYIRCW